MPHKSSTSLYSATNRYIAVDALRGLAMVWMTVFHFCFDLQHFGYLQTNFYANPFWTVQRTVIVSLFVFCAGLGQAVAVHQGQSWARFWRRWWQIAVCSLLVSVGSWFMFPQSYIYFGILHGMALMLVVVRYASGTGPWLWLFGALALAMPWLAQWLHAAVPTVEFLNGRAFNWMGLISHKPVTADYAPLFPWLGVMCWGLATGQWLLRHRTTALQTWGARCASGPIGAPFRGLALLGRWSLSYYMLHQPVLLGALSLVGLLR
jgi:uncharacterized membrane protein